MMTIKPRALALLCGVGLAFQAADAAAQTISVGPQPCAAVAGLSVHPPENVPGAAYTPGVDARGNAVAPADLPAGGNADLAKSLSERPVKITSALLGKYGIPANAQPFGGRAELGYVTVRDGKAYIDGQPLSPPETATLAEACKQPR
jgi:hypothetical protein